VWNSRVFPSCWVIARGASQQGFGVSDSSGARSSGTFYSESISLGATRLRILDLDGGDQPLLSADGDVVLIFNGEIFNYPKLRTELEAVGDRTALWHPEILQAERFRAIELSVVAHFVAL
jgi:hypothetical protein